MNTKKFQLVAMTDKNDHWQKMINRNKTLYERKNDLRTDFGRDYTRILHCQAYRRLKHKTQVFFNIENDHVCTRMEHVSHVESVSYTIAMNLGLNTELTKAIAMGHDLGHAPFGHHGEYILDNLCKKFLQSSFWHERNGLRFVDSIELLESPEKKFENLDLTYAVRDGIVSHCGEVDQKELHPREDLQLNLYDITRGGEISPATWEGCVVKMADKIAYLGRDIEDALRLNFLDKTAINELNNIVNLYSNTINTTFLIHAFITDICKESSPENGIKLSQEKFGLMNEVKSFNTKYIYINERLNPFKKYAELVINELYNKLYSYYKCSFNYEQFINDEKFYPKLIKSFKEHLMAYCDDNYISEIFKNDKDMIELSRYANIKNYNKLENNTIYVQAIIDFISGMTDRFAVETFNELITY